MTVQIHPNKEGFYNEFGGAFIPESLKPAINELRENYLKIIESKEFTNEFISLLKDYVGRPSPLYYAQHLSNKYQTNVFLKREDLNHTGAHKINNTIGQILLAKYLGKKKIIAETGAGQHGVATATVCAKYGMECKIFMGALDIKRQAPNVGRMRLLGAEVIAAESGTKTLTDAVNEALNEWTISSHDTFYLLGSVVGPHPYPDIVTRFQSIISKEISKQIEEKTGKNYPDVVIACVGGGSNAAGAFYEFLNNENVTLIGAEAAGKGINTNYHAATLTKGKTAILHGSNSVVLLDENNQIADSYSISSGLDYPGIGPLHAHLAQTKRAKYIAISDEEAISAANVLMKKEGIIPALESSHALAVLDKVKFNRNQNVVINLSGRGDKDLETFLENIQ